MSRLSQELEAALETLSKAVLSQPVDKTGASKVSIRPLQSRGGRAFQVETIRGTQAFHQNLNAGQLMELFQQELDGRFRQALIVTETESAQFTLKTNGSYRRTASAAVQRPGSPRGNDREKRYLLEEGEAVPALVDLGVFTPDYRIVKARYDKM